MTTKLHLDLNLDCVIEENAFQHAIFPTIGSGLFLINRSGRILCARGIALDNNGSSGGETLEKTLPTIWPVAAQTLADGRERREFVILNNQKEYLAGLCPILKDKEVVGALCFFFESPTPIGLSQQVELCREISHELKTIFDASHDGLFIVDAEGKVARVNPASERINKLKAEDIIGKDIRTLVKEGLCDRSAALEALESRSTISVLQKARDGSKCLSTGTPVFNDNGKLERVVVSERAFAEMDDLQQRLEEEEAMKNLLRDQVQQLQQAELESRRIIAKSPSMLKSFRQALKVSSADSSVLIMGESGVGKGLIADLIHKNSPREENPMIKINCGAIPESLIESELFGYEKGAFTGAQGSKPGYLEMADNGTLFLDEIAELPLSSQVKLLRFLEDGRVTRLGGTQSRSVDVRILAATHRDLKKMVDEGGFRLDLFYRLNVIPIYVPAVRERKECTLPMIRHYINHYCQKIGIQKRLTNKAIDALLDYSYPGNVRELINICERIVVMSDTELIDTKDLPRDIAGEIEVDGGGPTKWPEEMSLPQIIESAEREVISQALKQYLSHGKIAAALRVSQPTITRKIQRYGLGKSAENSKD